MSVERIALDIKVEIQGLVEALEGKGHCPYLPMCRHSPTVHQFNTGPSPNMYSTCVPHFLIELETVRAVQTQ